jgi:hypothetical protein
MDSETLFGVLFCGISTVFVIRWACALVDSIDSRDWPDVAGTVIESRMKKTWHEDGSTFRVTASYRYVVRDRAYVGRRIRFGGDPSTSTPEDAEDLLWQYARGKEVRVYHAPDDPAEAVLDRSVSYADGIAAIVFLLIGLVSIVFGTGGVTLTLG